MTDYIFFSSAYGTYTKIDCIQVAKQNINKFQAIEIIQSMFFSYNGIKLEISKRKISEESQNIQVTNNTLLNNLKVKEDII